VAQESFHGLAAGSVKAGSASAKFTAPWGVDINDPNSSGRNVPTMPIVIYDHAKIDFDKPGKHHYQIAFHLDSSWGYSLVPLTVINGLREPKSRNTPAGVAAFGGTHGNEWEGQVAVKRLCRDLDAAEICGRVILVPQLSESACVANTRTSPLDGVNMNRAFPGNPRGTISYRIAHFVKTCIFPRVRVVIDIHSGGNEARFDMPLPAVYVVDDKAQFDEMIRIAQLFDSRFINIAGGTEGTGLLPIEAERDGKIVACGEFGYAESVDPKGTLHAYEGIKNILRHYGILPGPVARIDPERSGPARLLQATSTDDYVPAPRSGIWEPTVEQGSDASEGDLLGRLHDFADHSAAPLEVRAHRAGVVMMMHFTAVCPKGVTLYVIGKEYQGGS
jgi:N2-acetyl-L-2,4-diaminobutanoate deacetylase